MPNELDFMKTRDQKGMPEEEYKSVRDGYNKKADDLSALVRKVIFIFMCALFISFAAINIAGLAAAESIPEFSFFPLLAFIIIIALFLYDPKIEDDKKYKYEADQKIILKSLQGKIKANKIRLGAVISLGVIAAAVNIGCWWFLFDMIRELQ